MNLNNCIAKKAFKTHDGTDKTELSSYHKAEIIQNVKNWFSALGWQTKESKVTGHLISRKDKSHVKINWRIVQGWRHPRGHAVLSKQTPNGGWSSMIWDHDLSKLIKISAGVTAPVLITKSTLPSPIQLGTNSNTTIDGPTYDYSGHDIKARIILNNVFNDVAIVNAVGLEQNGVLSPKAIFKPEEQIWFHMILTNYSRTSYHIITDGEILHPVRILRNSNTQKYKVTSNTPIDLKHTTSADKKLICKVIEHYLFKVNNA